jgi:hypothetical protein
VHPTYSREAFAPKLEFGIPCATLAPLIARGLRRLDLSCCFNILDLEVLVKATLQPGVALRYLDLSSMEVSFCLVLNLKNNLCFD